MNYKKQLIKFDTAKIINLSLLMFLIPLIISSLLNILVFGSNKTTGIWYVDFIIYVISGVMLIVLHELLHALGFIVFGKASTKEVKFGVAPKQGMVFCTCSKPMPAKAYLLALVIPVIVTGIIPLIIVTIVGNFFWIVLFSIMVSGGAGDLVMLNRVRKHNKEQLIMDHPKAPAYYLVYEQGKEPADFVEATEEMEKQIEEEMNTSPFEGENSKKSVGLKVLKILLFLSLSCIVLGIIGILLLL